jgi:adenosyl cobinamide kinase/adenosyl cobinamide phosphate guanylyltransferase
VSGLNDKVIISDDISSGVVPVDREMRQWREALGRSLAMLAEQADEVIRVFCGIASRIK